MTAARVRLARALRRLASALEPAEQVLARMVEEGRLLQIDATPLPPEVTGPHLHLVDGDAAEVAAELHRSVYPHGPL